jgi:hypothetical protein
MHTPAMSRAARTLTFVLIGCLVFLFAAVLPASQASASVPTPAQRSAISTNCPASGTANAAAMPSMTLGTHPNIVYVVNQQGTTSLATLKRYDVVTGSKVAVVNLSNTYISDAQVSADGQWLMFVAQPAGATQNKLQLVRMDGKYLQTLYCGAPGEVQWSTDQKLAVFSDSNHIYLLTLATGSLQVEVSFSGGLTLHPRTWLDTTRAYLAKELPDGPPETLVVLDTSKGPNQNPNDLQVAFDATPSTPFCWDFDSSFDGKSLFTSQCTAKFNNGPGATPCCGPGVIVSHPPTGGDSYTYVYVNQNQAFTSLRAVTASTLLFTVGNTVSNTSQNGVWRVGTDGSNPLHLTPSGQFNQFTQFPWSNVSRDGTKYALQIVTGTTTSTYTLEYGSLSGGSPTVFASITGTQLATVGWTTM